MSTPFWKQVLLTNTFIVDERGEGQILPQPLLPFVMSLMGGHPF